MRRQLVDRLARQLRIDIPGLAYHAWANSMAGTPLYRDSIDKERALELLLDEVAVSRWTCLAYVLMTTHFHVLIRLNEATLSSGFHRFDCRYAEWFNKRHDRRGHVFDGRFESKVVEGRFGELEVARYIALNPVRARLCEHPEAYPWSSYGSTIGLFPPDRIVDRSAALAPLRGSAAAYRTFVEEADPRVRWGLARARPPAKRRARANAV